MQGIFIFVMGAMHFSQIAIAWRTVYEVREDNFDKFLTRPFKPLTYLTLTSLDPKGLGEVFVGIAITAYCIAKLRIPVISWNFVSFIIILAIALVFTYAMTVIIAALAFLVVKSFGLFNIFFQIMDLARYPSTIYSYGLRFFLSFFLPVAVASTLPSLALIQGYNLAGLIWVVIPVAAFLFMALLLWNSAMKKYSSAGG